MPTLEIDDVIVLLLGSPTNVPALENQISGITRLEKLIFLIENESSLKELICETAGFTAYNFGPFSAAVYKAVDSLHGYDLIEDTGSLTSNSEDSWEQISVIGMGSSDPYATRDFRLTDKGIRYYSVLRDEVPGRYIDELTKLKEQFGSIPLKQLVRYVYQRYPTMTKNSIIRDDILGDD